MNKKAFVVFVEKIERSFKPLAKDEDERAEKVEVYYDRLKNVDEYVLGKAISYLQDNYEFRNFPLIADILSAIQYVKDSMRKEYHQEEECGDCQGTGYIIKDIIDRFGRETNEASPCHCSAGDIIRRAWKLHDARVGRQRYTVKLKKAVDEIVDSLPDSPPPNKDLFQGGLNNAYK